MLAGSGPAAPSCTPHPLPSPSCPPAVLASVLPVTASALLSLVPFLPFSSLFSYLFFPSFFFSFIFFPYLVWFFHSFALGSFLECFFSPLFLCPQEPQPCQRPQHPQHPQRPPCPQHPHNPSVPHILSAPICLASTAPPIPSIPLSPASWPCSRRTWLTNPPLLQPIGAVSGPWGPQQSLCGPEPPWQGPAETPSPPPWVWGHPRDTS